MWPATFRDAENGHASAAFELGVLLINNDAPQEGCLFLQRAASMNAKLTLTLPDLAVRDRLCGTIVADIYRHIADAYLSSGLTAMAAKWRHYIDYIDYIDTTFPLSAMLYRRTQPIGRHARNISHDLVHLEDSEMNRSARCTGPSARPALHERRPGRRGDSRAVPLGRLWPGRRAEALEPGRQRPRRRLLDRDHHSRHQDQAPSVMDPPGKLVEHGCRVSRVKVALCSRRIPGRLTIKVSNQKVL
ncbi:hypothetical protein ITP53_49925 [Nonomuraea sp. K274]|uniref:Uncharacterized protein n=1 Tax=Nonomuraea cypriaca TaxID=1187855 RepID=A0A931ARK6_9ACTN|nr:hypothetical protein [Nonomuraea cypriaca]MBF8193667.1 hypothetical protein [Nonomuraea cypriaca]